MKIYVEIVFKKWILIISRMFYHLNVVLYSKMKCLKKYPVRYFDRQ